ncbi:hypothetical protein C8J56DRAFT_1052899 [Mycena floridula]|nr:hypothetical protein C8J56DRAFT_1052899 [Mycena floridula]
MSSLSHLVLVLDNFFPRELTIPRALSMIATFASIYPLLRLHQNQHRERYQRQNTGWFTAIREHIKRSWTQDQAREEIWMDEENNGPSKLTDDVCRDLPYLLDLLGLPEDDHEVSCLLSSSFFPKQRPILCTTRVDCEFCVEGDGFHTLRRREKPQVVRLLSEDLCWVEADLFVAHCVTCKADYLPDKITYFDGSDVRVQNLNLKHHTFNALLRFYSGWSNFASWMNDALLLNPKITNRQSQRLFLEYFGRRLVIAHGLMDTFRCPANPNSADLSEYIRDAIGRDGGILASSMDHGCLQCTRWKRFREDLVAEGVELGQNSTGVADVEEGLGEAEQEQPTPANLDGLVQTTRIPGAPRGYVRQAVMDGKNMGHRKCALDACTQELVNYRNGRFCEEHSALSRICGIMPCGQPIHSQGARTCANADHHCWEQKYSARFARLSFPGVQRVIRRQAAPQIEENGHQPVRFNPISTLPALGDIPGDRVSHTFRAKSVYCLQTVQWACGVPIGWGKCYRSESPSQVLRIVNKLWENHPSSRPSFLVYDDACDLLRHIVTQNPQDIWITSTKFIVDAWHYIGHQATDVLCRTRCNPAPTDGSQPDLIISQKDDQGRVHATRAFNTETAEQFNAWLDHFGAQLKQMTARNYDVFVHVLFLLYKEMREKEISAKGQELTKEFWDIVKGKKEPEYA